MGESIGSSPTLPSVSRDPSHANPDTQNGEKRKKKEPSLDELRKKDGYLGASLGVEFDSYNKVAYASRERLQDLLDRMQDTYLPEIFAL